MKVKVEKRRLDPFVIRHRHPKCAGTYNPYEGDYDCGYSSLLDCEDCKYGHGRKDPEAKCNQLDYKR